MRHFHRCMLAATCLALAGGVAGCAKSDQQVCTDKGFAPGTVVFADCMQHQSDKHAMIEQQQEARDRAIRNGADGAGHAGPSCGGSPDKLGCSAGY